MISRNGSASVNEDGAEIVHVRESRARHQQVAETSEEFRRIVVGKVCGRIEAKRAGPLGGVAVGKCTGRIGRGTGAAIGAVGVSGEAGNPALYVERRRKAKRIFLVRPAF